MPTDQDTADTLARALGDDDTARGSLTIRRRDDGAVELGEAEPVIAVTIGVLMTPQDWIQLRDGLVCFTGHGPDGVTREVRYRARGFRVAGRFGRPTNDVPTLVELAACEGGYLILERVA